MKLLYVWFDEYKKLKDFKANLGSEYIFDFNKNKKIITIEDNKSYIRNFFKLPSKYIQNTKSIDVSAIVGENGSGKSTVLEFIAELMSDRILECEYILIYSIDNHLHILSSFQNEITYVTKSSKVGQFCISPLDYQKHLTLLFSNVFDARSIGMVTQDDEIFYKNITTNYLLSRENSSIWSFLRSEFENQIYFIHEYKQQLDIQDLMRIPEKIFIDVLLNIEEIVFTDPLEYILDELNGEDGKLIATDKFDYPMPNVFYMDFYSNSLKAFLVHLDSLVHKYGIDYDNDLDYYSSYLSHYSIVEHKNIFDGIYKQIKSDLPRKNKFKPFLEELLELSQDFDNFCNFFSNMKFNYDNDFPYILTNSLETKEFISLYEKAFTRIGCLNFSWSDMSSGEYGMLSLFSRFHQILKVIKREQLFEEVNDENDKTIIKGEHGVVKYEFSNYNFPTSFLLLIDEGDLYFHPQWQKDWLFYFVRLVELIFSGEVQIILTTHSPFVLSDFPNTNVIFLKNNIHTLVSSPFIEGSPKTFASNIIELFSNSFFIKDGLIGSFAKEKTNYFIHNLLKLTPEETHQQKEEIKKFIDIIGEPLIRNKVLQIYNGKLELYNETDLGQRILLLEQELKQLKELNKKDKVEND